MAGNNPKPNRGFDVKDSNEDNERTNLNFLTPSSSPMARNNPKPNRDFNVKDSNEDNERTNLNFLTPSSSPMTGDNSTPNRDFEVKDSNEEVVMRCKILSNNGKSIPGNGNNKLIP